MLNRILKTTDDFQTSLGLLVLRLGIGGMMAAGHGYEKLMGYSQAAAQFPDPLGVGSPTSMALAIFAEFFCSILLVLGLTTRAAAIPLMITMGVAVFIIHASDPWKIKELAALYLVTFTTILFTGAGKFSLDAKLSRSS